MGTLKKYRFKLAWQQYRVGAVIEPTGVTRDWLLSNGYIELVAEPPQQTALVIEQESPAPDPQTPPAPISRRRERAEK